MKISILDDCGDTLRTLACFDVEGHEVDVWTDHEQDTEALAERLKVVGHVQAIFRYPVKSMAGEPLSESNLGWHGLNGDRRFAFRKVGNTSGMPWLTAGRLPDLLRFAPLCGQNSADEDLPTQVRTPAGKLLPLFSEQLADEVSERHGAPVQMMHLRHGIFDEATISVITSETVNEIGRLSRRNVDVRQFRANIVIRLLRPTPFQEDEWIGRTLSFGKEQGAAVIAVTTRDERCSMVNFDADSAVPAPEIMTAIVRANQNKAGIYGAVVRTGRVVIGQRIFLHS